MTLRRSLLACALVLAGVSNAHADAPSALAQGSNAFGFDLYARIRNAKGNLAFSPASISFALTMTWAAARGETAAQMSKVLHLDAAQPADATLGGEKALIDGLQDPARKLTLRIANRLFAEQSSSLAHTKTAFGADLETLDFKGAAEAARQHINKWVADNTNDRIKDLLPARSVTSATKLVLVNAVYFLADWQTPFEKDQTHPAPFHVSASEAHDVATMHRRGGYRVGALDGVSILELPYKGGDAVMTLVLPDAVDGLAAVEKELTPARFDSWIAALSVTQALVSLPSFTIEGDGIALHRELAALGMPIAFDAAKADFSGNDGPKADRLAISDVFHKAFIKLEENGTEAAAATAVVMMGAGVPAKLRNLTFDHPFLFFLRDVKTGMILFMGRVSDPGAAK